MGTRSNAGSASAASRRNRYARSSTVSVTQLLTDSCSNLIHRFTSRVRGPSAALDNSRTTGGHKVSHRTNTDVIAARRRYDRDIENIEPRHTGRENADREEAKLTRSRYEDSPPTYSVNNLDRYIRRRHSPLRQITKSATTSTILLAEKAYPYVSGSSSGNREKTPYRANESYKSSHRHAETGHRHVETRPHKMRPLRAGRSELSDSRMTLIPIPDNTPPPVPASQTELTPVASPEKDDVLAEREAKRKEIQSLIMKYTNLDDMDEPPSALARCQQKYSSILAAAAVAAAAVSYVQFLSESVTKHKLFISFLLLWLFYIKHNIYMVFLISYKI